MIGKKRIGERKRILALVLALIIAIPCAGLGQPQAFAANSEVVSKIESGYGQSMAVKADGTLWFWGLNGSGQFGNGTKTDSNVPIQVSTLSGITAVAGGDAHSLALTSSGTVLACGSNAVGQLGDGRNVDSSAPVLVSTLSGITAVAAGWYHSVALKEDGTVWTWGANDFGQLGDGSNTPRNIPEQVSTLSGITAIAAGGWHTLALKEDGTVWAWGRNTAGQLGDGTTTHRNAPVQLSTLADIKAINGGLVHSMAVTSEGAVWTWGSNDHGQLGNGTNSGSFDPVLINTLSEIKAVDGGWYHSIALKEDGTVWTWGYNGNGGLGIGTNTNSNEPVKVSTLADVKAIAAGIAHSLALTNDGAVWGWGFNGWGQLGCGSNIDTNTPIEAGTFSTVAAAAETASPTVGADNKITLKMKNVFGAVQTSFSGTKNVTISGVQVASDGSYGTMNGIQLTSAAAVTGQALSISFTGGIAEFNLKLSKAGTQNINFSIAGVQNPNAAFTITPVVAGSRNHGSNASTSQLNSRIESGVRITTLSTAAKMDGEGKALATVTSRDLAELIGRLTGTDPAGKLEMTVTSSIGMMTFDQNAIKALAEQTKDDLEISVSMADTEALSEETKQKIGNRPVFEFSVTSGGKVISQFGGNVTLSVPYKPTPDELDNPEGIIVWYINDAGKAECIPNGHYDPATGTVTFVTNHFSVFGLGYRKADFYDISANAWYSKAVGFLASRDITGGTGNGNYRPQKSITRAEFLTMLMRAYDIDQIAKPVDNFADAGNTWYTGYLATAKKMKITEGVGGNRFAPEQKLSRQEMLALLYNTLKAADRLPEAQVGKSIGDYSDAAQLASWAKDPATSLVQSGIISGSGSKLNPESAATRAEVAQVIYNLLK